jgi:microcystin-dependent protein
MSDPYIGEIRMVGFSFAPKGWSFCAGQTLQISQNAALFSLLGTTYGGNGQTTFNLPDLRGRTALGVGTQNGNSINWGEIAGQEQHTLTIPEMPSHTHTPMASSASPNATSPSGNFWASNIGQYSSGTETTLAPNAIALNSGGQAHENRSPYLVINFIIALVGIFPSRS